MRWQGSNARFALPIPAPSANICAISMMPFRSYESVIHAEDLKALTASADLMLLGDYHALPACQRFAAKLLEERALLAGRPIVLGVETIFARDQHILDEWWRREIDEAELRRRIRFDLDWGYDWAPFYELLTTARDHAEAVYGLDCMPREDLRKINARDRHAAHKIAEIRQSHPNAVIIVLFGESHLAPNHLPRRLREQMPQQKILTLLQNVDALYWRAAGEQHEHVEAVRINEDTVCVFNSTPLEKYENYRLHLSRWELSKNEVPDLAPTIFNLMDSLLRFFGINCYSARNHTQPKFLVDMLPEVFSSFPQPQLLRLLQRETASEEEQENLLKKIDERGSTYLPRANAFYVREFQVMYAAEEAARFLHHVCRGLLPAKTADVAPTVDHFYTQMLEHALGYFGSRVLSPARPAAAWSGAPLSPAVCRKIMESAVRGPAVEFRKTSQDLGYALGNNLYESYLAGRVALNQLRYLFLANLEAPSRAREVCAELIASYRSSRKGPYPDHGTRARRRVSTS